MRKFLHAIITVFFILPIGAMGVPAPAAFSLHCAYPGDVNCQINNRNSNIIAIDSCEQLRPYQNRTPGTGKALLIKKSGVSDCLSTIGAFDRNRNCTRRLEYVSNAEYYFISCDNETSYDTIYDSSIPYDIANQSRLIGASYAERLCRSTRGRYSNGNCSCGRSITGDPNQKPESKGGQCMCRYGGTEYPSVTINCAEIALRQNCTATGGNPIAGATFNCTCPANKHLKVATEGTYCECNSGYIFQDPFNRSLGCVPENVDLNIGVRILDPNNVSISGVTATYSNKDGATQTQVANSGVLIIDNISNTAYVRLEKEGFAPAIYSAVDLNTKTSVTMQPITNDQTDMQEQAPIDENQDKSQSEENEQNPPSQQEAISELDPKKGSESLDNTSNQQGLSDSTLNPTELNELSSDLPPPLDDEDDDEKSAEETPVSSPAPAPIINNATTNADNITITGTVVDAEGPLPGVNVYKTSDSSVGAATNSDGLFTLGGLKSDDEVTFSYIGHEPVIKRVSELQSDNIQIVLSVKPDTLQEVTVTPNNDDPCTETGGELGDDGACFCNPDKNLSPAVNANFLPICKCTNNTYVYDETTKSCNPVQQENEEEEEEATQEETTPEPVPTEADITAAQQRLADAQQKLEDAREKQNSLGNRLVNAGASAATGYGARMVATAMAEQSADAKAESDMREWIDTMKCEYGDGQVFNVGTETIYLPGGDEISEYAKEYKNMAGELKKTKAALGLKPGIESETIYDRADYDLYSYNPAERQSSGNASVSRALMDSTSEDAIAWAEQKQESEQNKKIGTGVAIGGAAVGIGGNIAVNPDVRQKITDAFKKD